MGSEGRESRASVEIAELTEENLAHAPEWNAYPHSCKYCVYWEKPALFRRSNAPQTERLHVKASWLRRGRASSTAGGKVAYVDKLGAGYAQYAVPGTLPAVYDYPTRAPSSDAVFISCLFIPHGRQRGCGLGRQLLESILVDFKSRGIGAVETYGRRGSAENPSGPVEFYLSQGFRVLADDADFPLVRLEL